VNFFAAQTSARRSTTWMVALFVMAVLSLIVITNLLVMTVIAYLAKDDRVKALHIGAQFDWGTFFLIGLVVVVVVLSGTLYKMSQLSGGGRVVAESLGGQLIPQNSRDPLQRKILNVVEEMAIASGAAVPSVYLLEGHDVINAFAAGNSPSDAVIGITEGAVRYLTRDELQGVIAHEFSHIFNGDMRLNIRLMGVLHGILLIGIIGYYVMRFSPSSRDSRGRDGSAFLMLGLGLMAIGFLGTFFGQWIKATVNRQREYLADASAVQFTRNPEGIAGALKKIGGLNNGAAIESPAAPQYSHAYFANGVNSFLVTIFATHPPLEKRIKRVEPRWDGHFITPKALEANPAQDTVSAAAPNIDKMKVVSAVMGDALMAIDMMGQPGRAHIEHVRGVLSDIPEAVMTEAHDTHGAQSIVLALLADTNPAIRAQQWNILHALPDNAIIEKTTRLVDAVRQLPRASWLPLIDLSIPALRTLSLPQYEQFKNTMLGFIKADEKLALFEWVLKQVIVRPLDMLHGLQKPTQAVHNYIADIKQPLETVLSIIAYSEQANVEQAQVAFAAATKAIGATALKMMPRADITLKSLTTAMEELAKVKPLIKARILKACVICISSDNQVTIAEMEILRAIAATLDVPIPPILPAASVMQAAQINP